VVGKPHSSREEVAPPLVRRYTLALGIVAAFFALGAISIYSTADSPTTEQSVRWAFVLAGRLSLAIAALCALVTYLRARGSQFATGATDAFNVFLFLYFPFGTAASLYYWLAIRKRERSPRAA
jgi:cytochrome bd-type quinol oxidase subunit 2